MNGDDVPLPSKVAVAYNLKKGVKHEAEDFEAEFDTEDTVNAIKSVFENAGITVELIEADENFAEKVKAFKPDLVFNIAEGINGRGREGQVPAILSFLGIPYSGSDETTLCMALDKQLTKDYLGVFGVRSPKAAVIKTLSDAQTAAQNLRFPVIVKPNCEGSSKGVSDAAICDDKNQLIALCKKNLGLYGVPMLAEEYIDGREFTVGLMGNGDNVKVFEPMEIAFVSKEREKQVYSYSVKREYKKYVRYFCPPKDAPNQEMKSTALKIFEKLSCLDFARIDFRTDRDGKPYFIEINPLPGLAPSYSDFPMLAEFCGVKYQDLVMGVLKCALSRHGFN